MTNENLREGTSKPVNVAVPGPEEDATSIAKLTGRQKLWLVDLVIMKRVRFIAILAGCGVVYRLLGHGHEPLGPLDASPQHGLARTRPGEGVLLPDGSPGRPHDL